MNEELCTCGHDAATHATWNYWCCNPDCPCNGWKTFQEKFRADQKDLAERKRKTLFTILRWLTIVGFIGSCYFVLAWLHDAPWVSVGFGLAVAILGTILLRFEYVYKITDKNI